MPPTHAKDTSYECVVVGAGMAGLYTAVQLQKAGVKRIAIADKYKFLGGRTFSFKADISGVPYRWEEGAARISESHSLLLSLAREMKMKTVPIEGDLQFKEPGLPLTPDRFTPSLPILLEPLRALPAAVQATTTIRKLLEGIHGRATTDEFLVRYPYRAELDVMRADMALALFAGEFRSFSGYVYLQEGFSELVARLVAEFKRRGGVVLEQHECVEVGEGGELATFLVGAPSAGPAREEVQVRTRATVLAIPSAALERLKPLAKRLPWLRHLTMKLLVRVYCAFPVPPGGKAWFASKVPKMVSSSLLRFILPGDPTTGVFQISYTDSTDAEPIYALYKREGEAAVGKRLVAELRALLDRKDIPDPLFTKVHGWPEGVSYWLPGTYDARIVSREASHPLPKEMPAFFVCGESYSLRQCWVEGALEHAAATLPHIKKRLVR